MAVNGVLRLMFGLTLAVGILFILAAVRGLNIFRRRTSGFIGSVRATSVSSRRRPSDDMKLVEALAVWIEQLRDTMAGASGLEQALSVTAATAPIMIRPAVQQLAARLGYTPLPDSVRQFSSEIDHPLGDFVASALITASENQVRDMGALLSHLSQCCRDDVRMRMRIWVARARLRSAVRIIGIVVIGFILGLFAFNPSYLKPYATPSGMVVLAAILAMFLGSMVMMHRLGRFTTPTRFIARRAPVVTP